MVSNLQLIKPILLDDLMYGVLTTEPWNFSNVLKDLYYFAKIKQRYITGHHRAISVNSLTQACISSYGRDKRRNFITICDKGGIIP